MQAMRWSAPAWAMALLLTVCIAMSSAPPVPLSGLEHEAGSGFAVMVRDPTTASPEGPSEGSQGLSESPAQGVGDSKIDVCFCIDTTGSMRRDFDHATWDIIDASARMDLDPAMPEVRYALVLFRDIGQDYGVKVYDFMPREALATTLKNVTTGPNDDYPEAVAEALYSAVNNVSWDPDAKRAIFLMGDAPSHSRASGRMDIVDVAFEAASHGIVVNAMGMPGIYGHESGFKDVANITGGTFTYYREYWPMFCETTGGQYWWLMSSASDNDSCEEMVYGEEAIPENPAQLPVVVEPSTEDVGQGQGQGQGLGQGQGNCPQGQGQSQGQGQGQGQGQQGPNNLLSTLLRHIRDQGRALGLAIEADEQERGYDDMPYDGW